MRWTEDEDKQLAQLAPNQSSRRIAVALGKRHSSVVWRAHKLGIQLTGGQNGKNVRSDFRADKSASTQAFRVFNSYRMYITEEHFLITYDDDEIIRVSRRNHHHRPGFILLLMKLVFEMLRGTRTSLREHWALYELEFEAQAGELDLKCKANERKVLEFWFEKTRARVKGEEEDELDS